MLINTAILSAVDVADPASWAVEVSLLTCCIAIAARHDGIVRRAFLLGRRFPWYGVHQLTYHLGQLHRAMAMAATLWLAVAIVAAASADRFGAAIGAITLVLLMTMMRTARDAVRGDRHDRFEAIHRYGGWSALALIAVLVVRRTVIASGPSAAVVATPAPWLLMALICLVVHPWVGVRRVPVRVDDVTDQLVVLSLAGTTTVGEFARISRDGREWHSFAVATTGAEGADRYSLVIRRSGDWTQRLADDAEGGRLSSHLWVRRMRGTGFMYHAEAYEHVLFVATGAGIGPVLPYLLGVGSVGSDCLWIAHDHRRAVGSALVDRLLTSGRVHLVDTVDGRPDVDDLVGRIATRYEAVFVVSNAAVRDEVARACERVGARWYGPTFDS